MRKKRFVMNAARREALTGYLMTAPALILIFAVALFPVLRTFYLSTFDLRLNNASLSKTYTTHNLDLEYYADTFFRLNKRLAYVSEGEEKEAASVAQSLLESINQTQEELLAREELTDSYKVVYDAVLSMKSLNNDELTVREIEQQSAEMLKSNIDDVIARLEPYKDVENVDVAIEIARDMESSLREPNFVGFNNYKVLFSNDRLGRSLVNTFIFVVFAVFFELCIGILLGLLMNKVFVGRGIVRASILIPWSIPAAVSALMWRFMYDGEYGIISNLFESIGLFSSASDILTTKSGALFGLIFADIWKTSPYMGLMILAGLQTIDAGLYEAATIDGANKIQQFFKVTLPLLRPSILVALVFRTLDTFKVFDLVSVMTNGGPSNSTETISVYAYKTMFANMNFGLGSAIAVVMFVVLAVICVIYVKVFGADLFKTERES